MLLLVALVSCGLYYLFGGLLLLGLVGGCLVAFVLWLFVLVLLVR